MIGKLRRMRVISEKGRDRRGPGDGLNHKIGATGVGKLTMGKLVWRRPIILLKGTQKRRTIIQVARREGTSKNGLLGVKDARSSDFYSTCRQPQQVGRALQAQERGEVSQPMSVVEEGRRE